MTPNQRLTFKRYVMKKYLRRLAGYFVTIYANWLYRKAVDEAERIHEVRGERIYVASSIEDVRNLVIINRARFRQMKQRLMIPKFYIENLRDGAWYYTADRGEQNALPLQEKEIRRLAFVKHVLHRAGLV